MLTTDARSHCCIEATRGCRIAPSGDEEPSRRVKGEALRLSSPGRVSNAAVLESHLLPRQQCRQKSLMAIDQSEEMVVRSLVYLRLS